MIEKLEGARAEDKIRKKSKRTRVFTKTNAKTETLDIAKARADTEAREITHIWLTLTSNSRPRWSKRV